VLLVCLDGPHINAGELTAATKGLDVREVGPEGIFARTKGWYINPRNFSGTYSKDETSIVLMFC
jgi:hypothetical protein